MNKKIDISKIKVEFGGKNEPKDEKLINLLKDAYRGKLLVRTALIKVEGIKPFSEFKPNISDQYRKFFAEQEKQDRSPFLYVYPEGDNFIMSDDYNAYYLYREKGVSEIMCVVLGEADGSFVVDKSTPFVLPPPQAEILT